MRQSRPHEKLEVWKRSMDMCVDVYKATEKLPPAEKYGFISQMRRASVSVASNIAEGAGRGSINLYIQSLNVARASLAELDTQIELCRRLKFMGNSACESLEGQTEVVGKMLTNLIKVLRKK